MSVKIGSTYLYRNSPQVLLPGTVIATLGNFDGVHLGHQSLLKRVKQLKDDLLAKGKQASTLVISFYPHPARVLGRVSELPFLLSLRQKLKLLNEFGIDALYLLHFTPRISSVLAGDFVEEILFSKLGVQYLVVGEDASVGHKREGNVLFLKEYFKQKNRGFEVVPHLSHEGKRISSRLIRECVLNGKMKEAKGLLGRNYKLEGLVIQGEGRGQKLGFPTANLHLKGQLVPLKGVYATLAYIRGGVFLSVTNVGVRPTFNESKEIVEVHLLSYQGGSFYGECIELEFVTRLREEKKFGTVADLVSQIKRDIGEAKRILS